MSWLSARLWLFAGLVQASDVACRTDDDCSLLGECSSGGQCLCDPGWRGERCGVADLLPMQPEAGYINTDAASWGGRPVYAEGRWHLFATEVAHRCPLILFMNNSAVVRAEADSPAGPYTRKEMVLPPFHHNPQIIGPTLDGYYLLFSIGNTIKDAEQIRCEAAVPPRCTLRSNSFCRGAHMPYSNGRINLAYARSVHGPWSEKVILPYDAAGNKSAWNCENNNPTATLLRNGSVLLVYRANPCKNNPGGGAGGSEALGIALAAHWNGTYVRRGGAPLVSPGNGTGDHEDPFLWQDKRGHFHLLTHDQADGNVCGSRAAGASCAAHLYSRDAHDWAVGREPVYDASVLLANGTRTAFATRQRPQLVLNAQDGRPEFLFNGGGFEGGNTDCSQLTHTYAFAFAGGAGGSGSGSAGGVAL